MLVWTMSPRQSPPCSSSPGDVMLKTMVLVRWMVRMSMMIVVVKWMTSIKMMVVAKLDVEG